MVLDHVRDYFFVGARALDPTDPAASYPLLFVTRWITHLCAPTFVFLAGSSIWLQAQRGDAGNVRRHAFARGLWLIVLELTIVSFGFNFSEPFLFLQVIYAIGGGMILLALMMPLGRWALLLLGLAYLAAQPLLSGFSPAPGIGQYATILLASPGAIPAINAFVAYPLLPWAAVLLIGYSLGSVWALPRPERRMAFLKAGAVMLATFAILRWFNLPADPRPWQPLDGARSWMAFLNITKYPPSLDYVLATLGTSALIAAILPARPGRLLQPFLAYGRTPLVTYVLHIYIVHSAAMLAGIAAGIPWTAFVGFIEGNPLLDEAHWGVPLWAVYPIWIAVLAALFPVAVRFGRLKSERRDRWLGFL